MFSYFGERGDVTKPGNCKWCGRKLRPKWRTEMPPTVYNWHEPTQHQEGHQSLSGIIRRVKVGAPLFGDYADGYFCGLRCGYDFGKWHADHGNFLIPKGGQHGSDKT